MVEEHGFLVGRPSARVTRNSKMRWPGFVLECVFASIQFMTISFGRLIVAGGPPVSTTSTSRFGSTYRERGFARPVANACTLRPGATAGVAPFQPTILARWNGVTRY